jgi:hypothetical protein
MTICDFVPVFQAQPAHTESTPEEFSVGYQKLGGNHRSGTVLGE